MTKLSWLVGIILTYPIACFNRSILLGDVLLLKQPVWCYYKSFQFPHVEVETHCLPATFGLQEADLTGLLVMVGDACQSFGTYSKEEPFILVAQRGNCSFEHKAHMAEAGGASALIIVNTDKSTTSPMVIGASDNSENSLGTSTTGKRQAGIGIPVVAVTAATGSQLQEMLDMRNHVGDILEGTMKVNFTIRYARDWATVEKAYELGSAWKVPLQEYENRKTITTPASSEIDQDTLNRISIQLLGFARQQKLVYLQRDILELLLEITTNKILDKSKIEDETNNSVLQRDKQYQILKTNSYQISKQLAQVYTLLADVDHLRKASLLLPADPTYQFDIGRVLMQNALPQLAMICFKRSVDADYAMLSESMEILPDSTREVPASIPTVLCDRLFLLGISQLSLSHYDDAISSFSRVISLSSSSSSPKHMTVGYSHFYIAVGYMSLGDGLKAAEAMSLVDSNNGIGSDAGNQDSLQDAMISNFISLAVNLRSLLVVGSSKASDKRSERTITVPMLQGTHFSSALGLALMDVGIFGAGLDITLQAVKSARGEVPSYWCFRLLDSFKYYTAFQQDNTGSGHETANNKTIDLSEIATSCFANSPYNRNTIRTLGTDAKEDMQEHDSLKSSSSKKSDRSTNAMLDTSLILKLSNKLKTLKKYPAFSSDHSTKPSSKSERTLGSDDLDVFWNNMLGIYSRSTESTISKVKHDLEQLSHLVADGLIDVSMYEVVETYMILYFNMVADPFAPISESIEILTVAQQVNLLGTWMKAVYIPNHMATAATRTLKPMDDTERLRHEQEVSHSFRSNNLATVDGIVNETFRATLAKQLTDSTIWFGCEDDYVFTTLATGLQPRWLTSLSEDLRAMFPNIVGKYSLVGASAHKFNTVPRATERLMSGQTLGQTQRVGLNLHGYENKVSVTIFLSSPDANLHSNGGGGLIFYNSLPPAGWNIEHMQALPEALRDWLRRSRSGQTIVTDVPGRIVFAKGSMIRESNSWRFKSGYLNTPLVITLLYGV